MVFYGKDAPKLKTSPSQIAEEAQKQKSWGHQYWTAFRTPRGPEVQNQACLLKEKRPSREENVDVVDNASVTALLEPVSDHCAVPIATPDDFDEPLGDGDGSNCCHYCCPCWIKQDEEFDDIDINKRVWIGPSNRMSAFLICIPLNVACLILAAVFVTSGVYAFVDVAMTTTNVDWNALGNILVGIFKVLIGLGGVSAAVFRSAMGVHFVFVGYNVFFVSLCVDFVSQWLEWIMAFSGNSTTDNKPWRPSNSDVLYICLYCLQFVLLCLFSIFFVFGLLNSLKMVLAVGGTGYEMKNFLQILQEQQDKLNLNPDVKWESEMPAGKDREKLEEEASHDGRSKRLMKSKDQSNRTSTVVLVKKSRRRRSSHDTVEEWLAKMRNGMAAQPTGNFGVAETNRPKEKGKLQKGSGSEDEYKPKPKSRVSLHALPSIKEDTNDDNAQPATSDIELKSDKEDPNSKFQGLGSAEDSTNLTISNTISVDSGKIADQAGETSPDRSRRQSSKSPPFTWWKGMLKGNQSGENSFKISSDTQGRHGLDSSRERIQSEEKERLRQEKDARRIERQRQREERDNRRAQKAARHLQREEIRTQREIRKKKKIKQEKKRLKKENEKNKSITECQVKSKPAEIKKFDKISTVFENNVSGHDLILEDSPTQNWQADSYRSFNNYYNDSKRGTEINLESKVDPSDSRINHSRGFH